MRALMIPIVSLGAMIVGGSDEPSQTAMRRAFETKLAAQVQSALDYVAETAGAEALERVRDAGTDRFAIRSFVKLDCARSDLGHVCGFAVDLDTVAGSQQYTLRGRFAPGPRGLAFALDS
jgi:hypothetical protein